MPELLRLRELRKKVNMTQEEFATKIGMKQQQYSRYEQGARDLQIKHLKRICREFHTSADWLLALDEETNREGDE